MATVKKTDPFRVAESTGATAADGNDLELSIGHQVRQFRQELRLTTAEVAKLADLSVGMVSKIENGATSPSLATLKGLARALNVPVTALFRKFDQHQDATHVKANQGLVIDRQGTRAGHQYQLLGHTVGKGVSVEPYLVTLTEKSEVFPMFQHGGQEFVYILTGKVRYRHGNRIYDLDAGDSLFFDANAPHGPEELIDLPIRLISVIVQQKSDG